MEVDRGDVSDAPVVLWTDNKCSKFQPPEFLSSGDIGRQTWHRVIWLENRPETRHRPSDTENFNGFYSNLAQG